MLFIISLTSLLSLSCYNKILIFQNKSLNRYKAILEGYKIIQEARINKKINLEEKFKNEFSLNWKIEKDDDIPNFKWVTLKLEWDPENNIKSRREFIELSSGIII